MSSLLEVHEKSVNCEEDGNVQGQDSIDDDVKETKEEIEKKAAAIKMIDEDNEGIDDGDNLRMRRKMTISTIVTIALKRSRCLAMMKKSQIRKYIETLLLTPEKILMMQGKKLGRTKNINQQEEIKKDLKALYKDENESKEKNVTKPDGS